MRLLSSLVSLILPNAACPQNNPSTNATYLIAPALVTNAYNKTVVECWRLTTPFKRSSEPGVSGTQVATVTNSSQVAYTILPPRYEGGLHTAPTPQLVHFISGVAHVTLPQDDKADLWLVGGKGGLVFAVDTTGMGHFTQYPSDQETVAIVAPFDGGKVPEHEVIAEGPCGGAADVLVMETEVRKVKEMRFYTHPNI